MKTASYQFVDMGTAESFQDFARVLGTDVINNNITIPPQTGNGTIQRIEVSRGLRLAFWDINLKEPFELIKIAATPGTRRVFTLTYIFTKGDFLLQSTTSAKDVKLKGEANLLFDPGTKDVAFTLLAGIETRALVITFETSWLEEEFDLPDTLFQKQMHELIHDQKPFVYYQPVLPADYKKAIELFIHFVTGPRDHFYIKGNVLLLLSDFFKHLFSVNQGNAEESNILHYEKMSAVEKIINDNLESDLPPINQIALEVALSESTLKRCFKSVFGTSIYDYYLRKKMDFARVQLTEKKLPVKEVAYMLGYENSGSFIRIFKKYFSLPPGMLQKSERKKLSRNKTTQ